MADAVPGAIGGSLKLVMSGRGHCAVPHGLQRLAFHLCLVNFCFGTWGIQCCVARKANRSHGQGVCGLSLPEYSIAFSGMPAKHNVCSHLPLDYTDRKAHGLPCKGLLLTGCEMAKE